MIVYPNLEAIHRFFLGRVFFVVIVRPTTEHHDRGARLLVIIMLALQCPQLNSRTDGLNNQKERKLLGEHRGKQLLVDNATTKNNVIFQPRRKYDPTEPKKSFVQHT
jgi:hypothetical protein